MEKYFGVMAVLFALSQYGPYIYNTIKGRTKPQRVAWLIWFALGAVIFFSQLVQGGGASLWVIGLQMLGNLIVFLLAIKRGYGTFTKRDALSLVIAGFGLVLWAITKEPTIALAIAIFVDSIGAALVAIKAYHDPHGETVSTWVFSACSGLCAVFAVGSLEQLVLLAYPVYVVLNSTVTTMTIIIRKRLVALPLKSEVAEASELIGTEGAALAAEPRSAALEASS